MKAIVYEKYGPPDVLELREVEKPAPKADEVLVKVHAASVNAADIHLLRGEPFLARLAFGLRKPKINILGLDVAGQVEAVGKDARQFQPGDEVFGEVGEFGYGGFAEYVRAREGAWALKPAALTFEQAAAVPVAGFTALQALRYHGHIQPGQKVLINGASGGVGTFALQLAKYFGAEVTAVCSARNQDMARSLGADYVIDYAQEDFTQSGQRYDLILACNGYHSLSAYRRALAPNGIYVMAGGTNAQIFQALLLGPLVSKMWGHTMGSMLAKPSQQDLLLLKELLEAGKLVPVISGSYPFSQAIDAVRCVDEGHAPGKVVITLA